MNSVCQHCGESVHRSWCTSLHVKMAVAAPLLSFMGLYRWWVGSAVLALAATLAVWVTAIVLGYAGRAERQRFTRHRSSHAGT